jgi:PPOX class probable F420-dependent enzyme
VPGGSCARIEDLPDGAARVIEECRRAALATLPGDGTIATVPVCFALVDGDVLTAVDDKPKKRRELARLRYVRSEPRVTLLFDRWDEDWTRLGWVMVKGRATVEQRVDPSPLLRRYPQYRDDPPAGPFILVGPQRVTWWTWR